MRFRVWSAIFGAWAATQLAPAAVYPGKDWEVASPESQGLSSAAAGEAAAHALKHGGGSGCIIRHGYLVKEWGSPTTRADIKSCTKGSVGTTLLGLAVDAGLVKLNDLAQKHYPQLGTEKPENVATDWLKEITVRHLATMTAGFDDGRPPKLVYRPGTKGVYSNDTSNMLAELLALKFNEDLTAVLKRKVMDPIGVAPAEWAWRTNAYRAQTIAGLASREFASGITITHRALARLGYLYLREGNWNGQQILSEEFIRTATQPTVLPTPWPYYAFYWGSNAKGTYAEMPRDTYWALGLGDSFVVVCPSLDIVAVRLGTGSKKSQLPGGEGDDWGKRVAGFFGLIVNTTNKRIEWAPKETIIRHARGSDNWPMTWVDDDNLYTAYGDGQGFEPVVPEKLSLGFAKITGGPTDFKGVNIRSPAGEQKGDGPRGKKASGMLMVDGILYLWARNAANSQLAWSRDHGRTWTWSDWKFTTSFGCPTFLNFGKNYVGARDDYVYVYSPDADSAYTPADRMVLARVLKSQVANRAAYEFFQNANVWTRDVAQRGAVFTRPARCYRSSVSYNAGLNRYLLCQTELNHTGLAIYEAPEPWGPWSPVFETEEWDVPAGESCSLPTKWMSADGRIVHLVFSGDDSFSVRRATLVAPTRLTIVNSRWHINGAVTYPGTKAEGLLMNVRMVNATFEDRNRPDFDADANTNELIAQIPDYVAHGVRAFTLNLQGGMPGYEGAINSALNADGSLRESYLQRVRRVIEACDRHGVAVILGCYYQRQDQILKDEDAVSAGVVNVVNWIKECRFTNVALEIANEFPHGGFDYRVLRNPEGEARLIRLAKQTAPDLLVSTSGIGDGKLPDAVAEASDFLLIHFNGVPAKDIPGRIAALKRFGKPIVCNEDDKVGTAAATAAELSVANGASWGFMHQRVNQTHPFAFDGAADDPVVYDKMKGLTTP